MGLPPPGKQPAGPPAVRDDDARATTPARPLPAHAHTDPETPSAWKARSSDYGAPRPDPRKERSEKANKQEQARRRATRRSKILLVVFGGLAFFSGWVTAYETFGIPGIFLASQVGVPALMMILLGGISRVLRGGIGNLELAQATGALPRAAAWSLLTFWLFHTFTTVWQLAVSLALAIMAFQLYATYDRMRRAGHHGFGPGLPLSAIPLGAYLGWLVLFTLLGSSIPYFDVASMIGGYVFAWVLLSRADQATRRAVSEHRADPAIAATAPSGRGATAKHLLVGVIVGYLFFRFFVSANIPYGAVVEWFIVSLAALFFAIVTAARIGTVPTTKSLPPPHVRTHKQRVWSLPDQHLSQVERHLAAFIRENKEKGWVHNHYRTLLDESGVPEADARRALSELERRRTNEQDRRATILRLTRLMDDKNCHNTDKMKTDAGVAPPTNTTPAP